jgi:outer membrane translocation and assembly module TamA
MSKKGKKLPLPMKAATPAQLEAIQRQFQQQQQQAVLSQQIVMQARQAIARDALSLLINDIRVQDPGVTIETMKAAMTNAVEHALNLMDVVDEVCNARGAAMDAKVKADTEAQAAAQAASETTNG